VGRHVLRVCHRLGFVDEARGPDRASETLSALYPPRSWASVNDHAIAHGRATCTARRPACEACALADLCPKVGVTATLKSDAAPAPARGPASRREGASA
jgi:endonuclease-3